MLHLEQVLIHTCRNCNVHVNKQKIISLKCFLMYSAQIHSHDAKVKAALSLFFSYHTVELQQNLTETQP